jgi:hypothetical protein
MANFRLHFFKEKSRQIDIDLLLNYFRDLEGFQTEMDEKSVRFSYEHKTMYVGYQYSITPRSTVPDIYRLSPNYLDVNIHVDIPILISDFMYQQILKAIDAFTRAFKLFIYHPLFEDVMPFRYELLTEVNRMMKAKYIEKNHDEIKEFVFVDQKILYKMLKYQDDILNLKDYYKDIMTYVPKYQLLFNGKTLIQAIEIQDGMLTVIPPEINTIFIRMKDQTLKAFDYISVAKKLQNLLVKVPGTIEGTNVLLKKNVSKFYKILKKASIKNFDSTYLSIRSSKLLEKET